MADDSPDAVYGLSIGPPDESYYKWRFATLVLWAISQLPDGLQRRAAESDVSEWALDVIVGSRDVEVIEAEGLDDEDLPDEVREDLK